MLFLHRRALTVGADGAGRFRRGRGFVDAGIPWTVPGLAAEVYVDESFPKAVGPFGANPASAGHSASSTAPTSSPGRRPARCRRTSTRSTAPKPRSNSVPAVAS